MSFKTARAQAKGLALNVELRRGSKGVGLYATAPIKRNSVIAYYLTTLFLETLHNPHDINYAVSIHGHPSLIGDLSRQSLPAPVRVRGRWVTYWGYFSNEPGAHERQNCKLDDAMTGPFARPKGARRLAPGDFWRFKLVSITDISPGEEILWCYGTNYERDYASNCQKKATPQGKDSIPRKSKRRISEKKK